MQPLLWCEAPCLFASNFGVAAYSHEDAEWLKRLQIMLRPITRNHTITIWDDTQIKPGTKWLAEIQRALASAKVAVLLVSPHFLASDFIDKNELHPLLKAAEDEGLTILWVPVSASLYRETVLTDYQATNNPERPLDSLPRSDRNKELARIATKIREAATAPIRPAGGASIATAPYSYRKATAEEEREEFEQKETRYLEESVQGSLEAILQKYNQIAQKAVLTIPVVVHVVYRRDEENISDAQIMSQIEALNRDFRAKNPDIHSVPTAFQQHIGDARIEFALATKDPSRNPTSGITRTQTMMGPFSHVDEVQASATGGADPWDTKKYLNIWVCTLGRERLGVAQYPGGPRDTDGVIIHNRAFGTMGTAMAPFHMGRTAVGRIGKYLNLLPIWGWTMDCSSSDFVVDTPIQFGPNYGKPTFPHVSCNNGPNGDMFMNFMDDVDDDAMFMFTKGQVVRMHETLEGPRRELVAKENFALS